MARSEDADFRKAAQVLLRRRLRSYSDALRERQVELQKDVTQRKIAGGVLARGALLGAWAEILQMHCDQVVEDLLGLLETFDNVSATELVQREFDAHVDQAAAKLIGSLAKSRFGGASSSPSEQNRITNIASSIKAVSRCALAEELERSQKRRERQRESTRSLESSAAELDDRLPLNRPGAFDRDLAELVQSAKSSEEPVSLVMVDLDHFKGVNDQHGHPVGDEVLLTVAQLLVKRASRKGKAYRYGGEEFAVLLPNYSAEEAFGLAERFRKDLEEATVSSKKLKVTASFGVACVPDQACDGKSLLEKADAALYQAKKQGRNCVRVSGETRAKKAPARKKPRRSR